MFDFKASKYLTHFTLFRSKESGSNFQFGNLSFNRFGLQVAVNSITVSPIITPAGPTKNNIHNFLDDETTKLSSPFNTSHDVFREEENPAKRRTSKFAISNDL